jgi:phage gp46-like protein
LTDVAIGYTPGVAGLLGQFDLAGVANGGLQGGDDLLSAVFICLFSDKRARDSDVIDGDDRRCWALNSELGSHLWLLSREKKTQDTLNRAREYARHALQWLLDDGIAVTVTVTTEWQPNTVSGIMRLGVEIVKPDGLLARYQFAWDQLENRLAAA